MSSSLAHISHWYGELLYVGPVLVVVVWLSVANLREKHRRRREGSKDLNCAG